MKVVIQFLVGLLLIYDSLAFYAKHRFEGRIIDGENADPGEFPYQALLLWKYSSAYRTIPFCGGSIVSNYWIMTAAHCITILPTFGTVIVKVGKHHLSKDNKHVQKVDVVKRIIHEDFQDSGAYTSDIALLKLKHEIEFNDRVFPIDLPRENSIYVGNATLTGWGLISKNNKFKKPYVLQTGKVSVITNKECSKYLHKFKTPNIISKQICSMGIQSTVSACSGDSGGPLFYYEKHRTVQVGVVSWGIVPCGTINAPTVYTRVSSFVDWIKTIMKNN